MIDMLKVMADKNRLAIIKALKQGTLCVCDIEKTLQLPQNLVSHHLTVLKNANIVDCCPNGKNRQYSLNKTTINNLVKELTKLGE